MKGTFRRIFIRIYRALKRWEQSDRYESIKKKYEIHPSFRFNGEGILIYGDGNLVIGENSYIGGYSTIQISKGYTVRIGKNCRISHNVRIYTSSFAPDQDFSNFKGLAKHSGDIVIQDNVWIGANAFLNPGVTIGENAIIGANSVVTKDVEAFGIYGGVPAKLIRYKTKDA